MTNDTDSFVHEVDENLRQERMLDFAKKWGPWLIGAFVVLILGVLAWQAWRANAINESRRHSEAYYAAARLAGEGNIAEAKTAFAALREDGPRNYRVMARLEHAAILEMEGDLQAALEEFDVAAEEATDPVMRQTAQLRAAYIAAETQDFAALQARLGPLIEADSRLSFLARELLAVEAWEAGETAIARDQFESLSLAFDAPESVRRRAQVGLSVIGPAPSTSADGADAPVPSEGETK